MKIYLVGGAVRDQLLGLPIHERDWVVVGSTPDEMLRLGYKAVGKDFPVFLHPITHEEYALARTERKTAKGYKGFSFYTSPEVSLEEDLARRDLTINAMALDSDGSLIDPYQGQHDLAQKILRHVSLAFQEDPVRILRIARFSARFPDFAIHPDTLQLMNLMVKAGEVDALVSERVWQELARALNEIKPERFFESLANCDALAVLFPEIHSLSALEKASLASPDPLVRWAALMHSHSVEVISVICKRYKIPREYTELALLVARHLAPYQALSLKNAKAILDLLLAADALRRPERFHQFLEASAIVTPDSAQHSAELQQALALIKNMDTHELQNQNLNGEQFAEAIYQKRLEILQKN